MEDKDRDRHLDRDKDRDAQQQQPLPAEFVTVRRVEGLCLTTVRGTSAARLHSPSLAALDARLLDFCREYGLPATPGSEQLATLRAYAVQRCFPSEAQTQSLIQSQPRRRHIALSPSSSPFSRRNHKKAVNSPSTLARVLRALRRTHTHTGSTGLLLLPRYKLALCVPPKSGLVSVLLMLLAILGNIPDDLCGCHDDASGVHPKFGCLGMEQLRHYSHPMYEGLVYLNDVIRFSSDIDSPGGDIGGTGASDRRDGDGRDGDGGSEGGGAGEQWLRSAFTDPEWHSVMLVRDPWRRALSAFHEDNGYQGWLDLSSVEGRGDAATRRAALLAYLQRPMLFNHGRPAVGFCNLQQGLQFDHYYDIDAGLAGLADILSTTSPPVPREYLSTGWENCTLGGKGSVLEARLRTSHTWGESMAALDAVYCTPRLVRQAIRHFREDYRLLLTRNRNQTGLTFPVLPRCLTQSPQGVLDMMLLPDEDEDEDEEDIWMTEE
jgi:hypothetical protein